MPQEQKWFEMPEIRKRTLDTAVWIPLRASVETEIGQYGNLGYRSEFFGVGSLAIPIKARAEGEKLGWRDLGLLHDHFSYWERGRYVPADVYDDRRIKNAVRLVIAQRGNSAEPMTWHLHQDFVVALSLKREGDVWVAIDEGYIEVARLRTEKGRPRLLEVRAEHLKDYLCARRMALRIASYRKRVEVVEQAPGFDWPQPSGKPPSNDRWEGRVNEIHEGGSHFGSSMAVMLVTRKNLDFEEDVPTIGITDDVEAKTFTRNAEGRKLYQIMGELWRNEWVEPAKTSPRIKHDEPRSSVQFITTAEGKRETSKTLIDSGKWLWFQPGLIPTLFERRGGSLEWHTRDTGSVKCSPSYKVHFGVNSLGLVNAYAKDVAHLPEWQQKIWAGFNIGPEGKVSKELFAAQAQGVPANTQAPEAYLSIAVELLGRRFTKRFGSNLFRAHPDSTALVAKCHRFRVLEESGLYELAKDLFRLTAEHIDTQVLHAIVAPPEGENWGSLKSLEKVLATVVAAREAYLLLGPLHGIYNLRIADAHIPSADLDDAFTLTSVDRTAPFVIQGGQLIHACVNCLHLIADALK